tara:strand:+ start:1120 stop:1380 length:261 start_codon:yes stop_codon:yes gene_type:complete
MSNRENVSLVFLDLETTSLDNAAAILELAAVCVADDLSVVASFRRAVQLPVDRSTAPLSLWSARTHAGNGKFYVSVSTLNNPSPTA